MVIISVPFGRILDHYEDLWDNHRHDPNILIVYYEDLKEVKSERNILSTHFTFHVYLFPYTCIVLYICM